MTIRKPPSQYLEYFGAADLPEDGKFALHLCVDREELELLMSAAVEYCYRKIGEFDSKTYLPLFQAVNYLANPSENPCGNDDNDTNSCFRVGTDSKAIQFFYNDPYLPISEENISPLGQWVRYETNQILPETWIDSLKAVFGEGVDDAIGYFPNDVIMYQLPPDRGGIIENLGNFVNGLTNLQFPKARVDMVGQGRFQIELLSIPFGGTALMIWDFEISPQAIVDAVLSGDFSQLINFEIIELNRDIVSFPPETLPNIFVEVDFDTDGEHLVELYIFPRIDDSLTGILGNGGGVRSVTACGSLEFILPDGTRIGRDNFGQAQTRRDNVIMATVEDICAGMICASEEIARRILFAANKENLLSDIQIDKDTGSIVISNPPSQTPAPVDANSLELANGLTFAVGQGVLEFFQLLNEGIINVDPIPTVAKRLTSIFELSVDSTDTGLQNAISAYGVAYSSFGFLPNASKISQFVWLYGASLKTLNRYAFFVEAEIDEDIGEAILALFEYLTEEQISIWYAQGKGQPRQDYTSYPDYRIPSDSYIVTPDMLFTGTSLKRLYPIFDDFATAKPIGNRWALKASGLITHTPSGRKFSAYYQQNASLVWQANTVNLLYNSVGGGYAIETTPPLNTSGAITGYFSQSVVSTKPLGYTWSNIPTTILAADCTGQWLLERIDLGAV